MKLPRFLLASILLLPALLGVAAPDSGGRIYELRTYTAAPGRSADLLTRFREHTLKLFEKHGMVNVGYWMQVDEKGEASDKLVYLLAHRDREAARAAWKAFGADPAWQEVRRKTEANGKIVAKVESTFLETTDFSRAMDAGNKPGAKRIFELRTYTTPEGKLPQLDARFRNHTVALFQKHGMTNLGYFHPTDADKGAGRMLVYFLAHASRDAATASWKAFREDPVWLKARTESEKNGRLTEKVESVFLTPVDFSALK